MWLDKRVPHGAGLGGGSGNAATALWAANELSGRPAGREDLAAWAGEIGSDISVFFGSGASYCLGRGEVVQDVTPAPPTPPHPPNQGRSPPHVGCPPGGGGRCGVGPPAPLPPARPLLLLTPAGGLSTPAVFTALRRASRSAVDPRQLLAELQKRRTVTQDICVNDLEQPAFELCAWLAVGWGLLE